ncbi:uncharacterized protein METZ01_LOCUS221116, partial [marine metagenome]
TIAGNTASTDGGGLYYNIQSTSAAKIENSIIWGNSPDMISFEDNPGTYNESYVSIHYSDIQNGLSGITNGDDHFLTWGTGNISSDPLFPNLAGGTLTLDYGSGSPAINAGNPNGFYNDDDWEPNTDGPRNDMGANGGNGIYISSEEVDFGDVGIGNTAPTENFYIYNLKGGSVILGSYSTTDNQFTVTYPSLPVTIQSFEKRSLNVQFLATSSGDQTSTIELSFSNLSNNNGSFSAVGTAYDIPAGNINVPADVPTIQLAIDIAPSGKTIVVAPGEYFEKLIFNGKNNITLTSSSGPDQTIINASGTGTVVYFGGSEHILNGFTLTGGEGSQNGRSGVNGSSCGDCSFTNLIVTENTNGDPVTMGNYPTIKNVVFANNSRFPGTDDASAIYLMCGSGTNNLLQNVTIANNSLSYGINYQSNDASSGVDTLTLINSVIWGSLSESFYVDERYNNTRINIYNSLIEGGESSVNSNDDGSGYTYDLNWDSSNLTSYPYFNDPDNGDYSLSSYS